MIEFGAGLADFEQMRHGVVRENAGVKIIGNAVQRGLRGVEACLEARIAKAEEVFGIKQFNKVTGADGLASNIGDEHAEGAERETGVIVWEGVENVVAQKFVADGWASDFEGTSGCGQPTIALAERFGRRGALADTGEKGGVDAFFADVIAAADGGADAAAG